MLPDVWRMADRRARARARQDRGVEAEAKAVQSVSAGVEHHLRIDARFHRMPVFERGEKAAREALRAGRGAPKMGLFAHVAWELCLDGALLRRVGIDAVLLAVRASLEAVRPDAHHRAAEAWVDLPSEEWQRFEARVDQILDAIAQGRWIAGYATAAGLLERLEGLRSRLGFSAMGADDRAAVIEALRPLEHQADAGLDEVLA